MDVRVIRLLEGHTRKGCGFAHSLVIMPNSIPVKCSICKRGVVVLWPWGALEPTIRNCRVCKSKTTIRAEVELTA